MVERRGWLREEVGLGFHLLVLREGPRQQVLATVACSFPGSLLSACCPGLTRTEGKSNPTWVPARAQGGTWNKRNRMACTPLSHPGPPGSWVLIHSDGPLPWVGNTGLEEHQGLPTAWPPLSLTLAFPFLYLRFKLIVEQRVEG